MQGEISKSEIPLIADISHALKTRALSPTRYRFKVTMWWDIIRFNTHIYANSIVVNFTAWINRCLCMCLYKFEWESNFPFDWDWCKSICIVLSFFALYMHLFHLLSISFSISILDDCIFKLTCACNLFRQLHELTLLLSLSYSVSGAFDHNMNSIRNGCAFAEMKPKNKYTNHSHKIILSVSFNATSTLYECELKIGHKFSRSTETLEYFESF